MAVAGWYPRRRGILEHLERGDVSLLDTGIHDLLCMWADHRTGVCWASAEKIRALCPAGTSYKSIQRSLAKQERIGWIKRWNTQGKKGNYPILVCRYHVRDESMIWWATSGERTTDWHDVQFDPVHDPSFNSPRADPSGVREVDHDVDHEVSPSQEGRSKEVQEPRKKEKDDDDDHGDSQKTRTAGTGVSEGTASPHPSSQTKNRKLSPRLATWVRNRILKRAGPIRSKSAYLRAAIPEFLANFDNEVFEYLCEKAEEYFSERLRTKSNGSVTVYWKDVLEQLRVECTKHDLPVSHEVAMTCIRAASERLGMTETHPGREAKEPAHAATEVEQPKTAAPAPEPAPEQNQQDPCVSTDEVREIWQTAFSSGWERKGVIAMLQKNYAISTPRHLRRSQLGEALQTIQRGAES